MRAATSSLFVLITLTLLAGCATPNPPFRVYVDGMTASGATEGKRYVLLPGNKDTHVEDLQFQEFAAYVHRALASQGYFHASGFGDADLAIFLAYGIGDPQKHQYTYSVPHFGQTGVSSSSTYGNVSTFGNYGSFSATTTYTPTYGITGYTAQTDEYVTYFRFLFLDAYDLPRFKREQKLVPVWRTTVDSTGRTDDLRRVFPVLVAASKPYLGRNTSQRLQVNLPETDSSVLEIKGVQAGPSK